MLGWGAYDVLTVRAHPQVIILSPFHSEGLYLVLQHDVDLVVLYASRECHKARLDPVVIVTQPSAAYIHIATIVVVFLNTNMAMSGRLLVQQTGCGNLFNVYDSRRRILTMGTNGSTGELGCY